MRDRIHNTTVKSNLQVQHVATTQEENELRWFGDLSMNVERTARITYVHNTSGGKKTTDHLGGRSVGTIQEGKAGLEQETDTTLGPSSIEDRGS